MLSDANVARLAKGLAAGDIPKFNRVMNNAKWQAEWNLRYGWNRKGDLPSYLQQQYTRIKKVEIEDVYDLKRWWWKATDGIRETTWPGVYNRSRLPGRNDYFQLPDWDCYSLSGKSVTFFMPDELWNHLEISGSAFGKMEYLSSATGYSGSVIISTTEGPRKNIPSIIKFDSRGKNSLYKYSSKKCPSVSCLHIMSMLEKNRSGIYTLSYSLINITDDPNDQLQPLLKVH